MSERDLPGDPNHGEWRLDEPAGLEAYLGRLGGEPVVLLEWPAITRASHSSAEIAARRRRSRRTVENQLAAIYAKLGVRGRLQLFAQLSSPGSARA